MARGCPLSPIDGMPIGIKDIIETADFPTENGSPIYFGWRSERDGASVAALREAGAVILGKTVTTEFAATEPRGTRNPHSKIHMIAFIACALEKIWRGFASSIRTWQYRSANSTRLRPTSRPRRQSVGRVAEEARLPQPPS